MLAGGSIRGEAGANQKQRGGPVSSLVASSELNAGRSFLRGQAAGKKGSSKLGDLLAFGASYARDGTNSKRTRTTTALPEAKLLDKQSTRHSQQTQQQQFAEQQQQRGQDGPDGRALG